MNNSFLKVLQKIKCINQERLVTCCGEEVVSLHGFLNSSAKAYGAVVYARLVCSHGVKVRLWTSKSRLSPSKDLTIPRLELMGCLLLAKLMVVVQNAIRLEVDVKDVYYWMDSQIALWWIKRFDKVWKIWVQNRVDKIRKITSTDNWFYVPTNLNPADITTRDNIKNFNENKLWWNGPEYLYSNKNDWPSQQYLIPSNVATEEKVITTNINVVKDISNVNIGEVIQIERFSSFKKLLRVTGYVLRFVQNLKKDNGRRVKDRVCDG